MSNFSPLDSQYPNEFLGLSAYTSTNWGAAENQFEAPFKLNSENGAAGASFHSGSGAPTIGGGAGSFYFRTDTPSTGNQRIYVCTTAGTAGNAVWTGIV